ncbi:putative ABC transporter periplasmic protein [Magnetofaba australis IT-1]|uniref:Putative ABC transporter periplasmic protein n=1 Tax=Magnetofaba australis IT-1 TaxID=1434232 RepID=A0A1Y2JZ24_9PROT|nr:putative ABC transporter periplasmic protein [Magnetofaba australis IT-1]
MALHPASAQPATVSDAGVQVVLKLGILPYLSPRTLFKRWEPLRAALQERLGRPVQFRTAPDYTTFSQRVAAHEYDVALSTSHLGRLAQVDAGLTPLARPVKPLYGVVIAQDPQIQTLADLSGRSVALPDPLAIVSLMGEELLRQAGLEPGLNPEIIHFPGHRAAALGVRVGQADAAIISRFAFGFLPPADKAHLRVIGQTQEIPSPVLLLAAPQLSEGEQSALQRAILTFCNETAAGKRFMQGFGYASMGVPSAEEMASLDHFLPATRQLLSAKNP